MITNQEQPDLLIWADKSKIGAVVVCTLLCLGAGFADAAAAQTRAQDQNENSPQLRPFLKSAPARRSSAPIFAPGSVPASGNLAPSDAALLAPEHDYNEGPQLFDQNSILLRRPELKALVTIEDKLSPFSLDASSSQPLDLLHVLQATLDNNLDLAISKTSSETARWQYNSALGKFLPDLILGYQEYFADGKVAFPFNANSLFPSAGLASHSSGPKTAVIPINTPFVIARAGFNWNLFQGGKVLFGALQSRHSFRAARSGIQATLSDVLMSAAKSYYTVLLNEALLQIRVKAVQTSQEQLRVNRDRFELGLATNLDVLQAQTQLSRDKQNLIDQQVTRRTSAVQLADVMNVDLGTDLEPSDMAVRRVRLVAANLRIADLLKLAIDNRPELRQYEELRLAAKRAIVASAAPLAPTFAFGGSIYGIGPGLANTEALYVLNLNLRWNINSMGTSDYSDVRAAKLQARQAQLQAQKQLLNVLEQVRTSYLSSLDAERKIDETSNEVTSSLEELRLARLRFQHGLGTNLDIITGQRDYTEALIDKAQAIINFDIAQAQLVHDLGLTSTETLSATKLIGS